MRLFFLSILLLPAVASARVFDMTKEQFASYLVFSGGSSVVADGAMALESSATKYSGAIAVNPGMEFGFLYVTKTISWRFGFEVIAPPALADVAATNDAGTELYKVKSTVLAYVPKVGLEINLKTTPSSRWFLGGTAGTASVTVVNEYSALTIAPNADFTAKYKGSATSWAAVLGYEMAAFDTTTFVIEAGYRNMNADKLVYSEAVASGFSGAHAAGDDVMKTDGEHRGINLTGPYASLGFRFFLF